MTQTVFESIKEGLTEAIDVAKELRRIEDETEFKLDTVREAYMDGHICSVEYQIEVDAIMDWNVKALRDIGVKVVTKNGS